MGWSLIKLSSIIGEQYSVTPHKTVIDLINATKAACWLHKELYAVVLEISKAQFYKIKKEADKMYRDMKIK
jgi:hypothetical protein